MACSRITLFFFLILRIFASPMYTQYLPNVIFGVFANMNLRVIQHSPTFFASSLIGTLTITLLDILFSNILCSPTKFHIHTKQNHTQYLRLSQRCFWGFKSSSMLDRVSVMSPAADPYRIICIGKFISATNHHVSWLFFNLLMASFCLILRGPEWSYFAVGFGKTPILTVATNYASLWLKATVSVQ